MSSVKKMLLVDPGQWQSSLSNQTTQRPIPDGLGGSISTLDHSINNILTAPPGVDEYTKAQQYSQALQRYLTLSDAYRDRPLGKFTIKDESPVNDMEPENSVEVKSLLRQALPATLRSKGEALLDHLKTVPGIKWDAKQQLIVDGKTIPDSNVVDLVNDLIRDRKTVKGPNGWSEVSQVLVRNNIPKSLIPNTIRRESLSRVSTSVDTSSKERLKQKTLPLYAKLKNPPNRRETVKRKTKANTSKTNISTLADSPITTWLESA